MFVKKAALIGAAAAILGITAAAQAGEGAFIVGGRLAFNYSWPNISLYNEYSPYREYDNNGGVGFEVGLIGRQAIVPGELGLNIGANFIYRNTIDIAYRGDLQTTSANFTSTEMAVSVPVIIEISPALSGLRSSSVYEMIFLQLGLQADILISQVDEISGETLKEGTRVRGRDIEEDDKYWKRPGFDVGLVVGAVGYFSSNLALDIRYVFGFMKYDEDVSSSYLSSFSMGLSFFF